MVSLFGESWRASFYVIASLQVALAATCIFAFPEKDAQRKQSKTFRHALKEYLDTNRLFLRAL
eukprot:5447705-Prymnesium_polylepis.1